MYRAGGTEEASLRVSSGVPRAHSDTQKIDSQFQALMTCRLTGYAEEGLLLTR